MDPTPVHPTSIEDKRVWTGSEEAEKTITINPWLIVAIVLGGISISCCQPMGFIALPFALLAPATNRQEAGVKLVAIILGAIGIILSLGFLSRGCSS